MLDMSVRAKILQLMLDLKRELGLTYLYITHDLATAKFFCDRIAILYLGRIVEIGPSEAIYEDPKHPYTKALLRAIPEPDPRRSVPRDLPRGEVPDAARPPLGCSFHPRCPVAFEVCGWESRDLGDSARDPLGATAGVGVRGRTCVDSEPRRAGAAEHRDRPSRSEWQRRPTCGRSSSRLGQTIRRSRSGVACDGSSRRTKRRHPLHDRSSRARSSRSASGRVPPIRRREHWPRRARRRDGAADEVQATEPA